VIELQQENSYRSFAITLNRWNTTRVSLFTRRRGLTPLLSFLSPGYGSSLSRRIGQRLAEARVQHTLNMKNLR
jgi:hypothetical protein